MAQVHDVEKNKVYLVTSVEVAIDDIGGILIAGILSDSPFIDKDPKSTQTKQLVGNFAFTRQNAEFLRDRLNEFLQE